MKKEPRYFLSVVEEGVMNPKFFGYRAGRIEIYDNQSKSGYAIDEARFLIPEEFFHAFREVFDFKHTDMPVVIEWNMLNYPDERKKYYGGK